MSHHYGQPPNQPPPYGPQNGPYGQPYMPPPPMPPGYLAQPQPRNGLGLAALICGGVGCLFGIVAIGFVVAGPMAIIALALGITGMSRARKGLATNGGVATVGILLGIVAAALSLWGAGRVFTAVDAVNDTQARIACMEQADTAEEIWACSE